MLMGCPGPVSTRAPFDRCPRFLLVDDDELITRSVARVLRLARPRWEVTTLACASAGARELDRVEYDVAIVDLELPGLPGTALLEVARLRHPGVARVVFSARVHEHQHHPEVRAAHVVLAKPTTPDELVSVLAAALRTCASERVLARTPAPQRMAG